MIAREHLDGHPGFWQCDCCAQIVSRPLHRADAYGLETWACDACLGREPDEEDDAP